MRERTEAYAALGERLASAGPQEAVRLSDLARELELPTSTVHEWFQQLRFQRALLDAPGGFIVDRPRLLAVLTAHRVARITPVAEVRASVTPATLATALDGASVPHVFAMLTAANAWAFFEPLRAIQLYVPRGEVATVRALMEPGDVTVECFAENLREVPTARRGGLLVTSAFLTLLDCRAHPEGGAHAEFLERNVLRGRTAR